MGVCELGGENGKEDEKERLFQWPAVIDVDVVGVVTVAAYVAVAYVVAPVVA